MVAVGVDGAWLSGVGVGERLVRMDPEEEGELREGAQCASGKGALSFTYCPLHQLSDGGAGPGPQFCP